MSSIFGTAAKGMVAATGMTLLMWPVVDRVGFPYLVKESITQRDKGNPNPSKIANKIESLRKQYANDRSGVWLFLQLSGIRHRFRAQTKNHSVISLFSV